MITIKITTQQPNKEDNGYTFHEGIISIKNHQQEFNMPLTNWSLQDYKKQWTEGLTRIKKNNTSCLVINVDDLKTDPFIIMYCMYKKNKNIHIQYHIFGVSKKEDPSKFAQFSPESCYNFIPEYKIYPNDGCDYFELIVDPYEKNCVIDEHGNAKIY